jgi:hypothetical protein
LCVPSMVVSTQARGPPAFVLDTGGQRRRQEVGVTTAVAASCYGNLLNASSF